MKSNECRKRGYHSWTQEIESITDSFDEMTLKSTCTDCGMYFEATGDWIKE